jgi:ribonucleoside-diphosphate reductase alpha chain
MTGQAYLTSSMLAERVGPFPRWEENVTSMREVMGMHEEAARSLKLDYISREALDIWRMVNGPTSRTFRNAQTTVMAPTGTIGFMMDCDTTGIEPMLGLKVYKKLVGGGVMEITPACVEEGLRRLNYRETYPRILAYVKEKGTLEGCPGFKEEHLPVFDTSFPSGPSKRSIHYMGHIKMMAAIQPFLSGAISKTVNMPETATVEDIEDAYLQAWKLGLKAIAIYRDGSKNIQPLTTKKEVPQADDLVRAKLAEVPDFAAIEAKVCGIIHELAKLPPEERRAKIRQEYAALFGTVDPDGLLDSGCHQKLTGDRMALVHEFRINGHKAYLTVGMYPDGRPAEIFVDMAKEGSTISGLLDAWAISVSFNLQHNVPLRKLVDKFAHTKFDPAGWTDNPDIKTCDSVVDYIVRWLELKFLKPKEQQQMADEGSIFRQAAAAAATMSRIPDPPGSVRIQDEVILNADAPCCADCGSIMVRNGSCFKCGNCGGTSGCS